MLYEVNLLCVLLKESYSFTKSVTLYFKKLQFMYDQTVDQNLKVRFNYFILNLYLMIFYFIIHIHSMKANIIINKLIHIIVVLWSTWFVYQSLVKINLISK